MEYHREIDQKSHIYSQNTAFKHSFTTKMTLLNHNFQLFMKNLNSAGSENSKRPPTVHPNPQEQGIPQETPYFLICYIIDVAFSLKIGP